MQVSIFDILSKAAELANKDPKVQKEMAECDGDKVGFRFTDDTPVTVITNKGRLLVEPKERPDCQIVIELSAISLCDICDKTMSLMEIRDKGKIVKGELHDLINHMFALLPWFEAMTRYYEENPEFKRLVDEKKGKK